MFYLFLIILSILISLSIGYILLITRNLGVLHHITTESVSYNRQRYKHILDWDATTFYIHSRPILLLSGEFHYWRLPDVSRWKSILLQYKASGLNCIRIYFHWGYHSPTEGQYYFDGNRDVEYLLNLCEQLGLFVLAAPGPYICAETQAGGLPTWLVAKRHIRIRHSVTSLYKRFDSEYMKYCAEWYEALIPILKRHQITNNKKGCLIAFQIENENFEYFKGIPLGLTDDMKSLCKIARDAGIDVPFFSNDGWQEGSFIPRDSKIFGKSCFGLDLYGFDKYIVFCPTSAPLATLSGANHEKTTWPEWDPSNVQLNDLESKHVKFDTKSPLFIPELQGGWFNHYTVKHTYDDVYSYYGESYTKLVLDTVLGQGVTALNFYMFYGGTNWGFLGDPDVYTSYDYSACIREFGLLSGRARMARLGFYFARCFSTYLTVAKSVKEFALVQSCDYLYTQRESQNTVFLFFRNFKKGNLDSICRLFYKSHVFDLPIRIPYKQSFIGLAQYPLNTRSSLIVSTLPIHCKTQFQVKDKSICLWIVQSDQEFSGSLVFEGNVSLLNKGTLDPTLTNQNSLEILSWKEEMGWTSLNIGDKHELVILSLPKRLLYTLQACFEESYWHEQENPEIPVGIFFGIYGAQFHPDKHELIIEQSLEELCSLSGSSKVYSIAKASPFKGFVPVSQGPFKGMPFLYCMDLHPSTLPSLPSLLNTSWEKKSISFDDLLWEYLPMKSDSCPLKNAIDYCFTSGHVLYRASFQLGDLELKDLVLKINLRHRGTVYVNGNGISSVTVYSLGVFRAGSKNGPDNTFAGWNSIPIKSDFLKQGENQIVILIESFGLNRQPFSFNDVRSPRGILEAHLQDSQSPKNRFKMNWEICGVDTRSLEQSFNTFGIPNGDENNGFVMLVEPKVVGKGLCFDLDPIPSFYKTSFDVTLVKDIEVAHKLVVSGPGIAFVSINDTIIARYYGNGDGPQSEFYIPSGLLVSSNNELKWFGYPSSFTTNSWIQIEFDFWYVDDDEWSGNQAKLMGKRIPFYKQFKLIQ